MISKWNVFKLLAHQFRHDITYGESSKLSCYDKMMFDSCNNMSEKQEERDLKKRVDAYRKCASLVARLLV